MKAVQTTPVADRLGESVNENIRVAMARRRVTAVALAGALGLSTQALYRRQSGAVAWNTAELDAVAAVLELDVFELLAAS